MISPIKQADINRDIALGAIRSAVHRLDENRVRQTGPLVKAVPLDVRRGIHKNRYVGTGDGDRASARLGDETSRRPRRTV